MGIAVAATSSSTEKIRRTVLIEVDYFFASISIPDDRADWEEDDCILGIFAVHFFGRTLLAVRRSDDLAIAEFAQGIFIGRRAQDDAAAVSAVSAEWSTFRDILLASPCDDTFASVPLQVIRTSSINIFM